jgi:membrane-associated phospholipid phosphatase
MSGFRGILHLGAAGISMNKDDDAGLWQLVKSEAVTAGITYSLEYTVNPTSPDDQAHSFPSGQASIMLSAAQFLQTRYGWEYSVPAYTLTSFTAYSRVHGNHSIAEAMC